MKTILLWCAAGLLLLAMTASAWGDTLTLRDGTQISGTLVSKTKTRITFKNDQGVVRKYSTSKVESLTMASTGKTTRYTKAAAAKTRAQVLPEGTELVVRTGEAIDSSAAAANQTFSARVDQDVLGDSGAVAIPKGSQAVLVIRKASGGGVVGSPEMTLDIQSVQVGGKSYTVSTEDMEQKGSTGIGTNRRTAEMVGGGAAVGAIIGAIAGKGKGAVIGGAAGAAAGAGVQVLVKGKEVKVPAETVLTFKLDQPVTLQAR